jgi:hypothetical protein
MDNDDELAIFFLGGIIFMLLVNISYRFNKILLNKLK